MAQTGAPVLYRFLGMGLTLVAAVFLIGRMIWPAPASGDSTVSFAVSGISLVILAFAQGFIRPRVPSRAPGQTVEAYWATSSITTQILRVWFLTEGAGIMAGAGYWATGHFAPATVMIVATGVFWISGPDKFGR